MGIKFVYWHEVCPDVFYNRDIERVKSLATASVPWISIHSGRKGRSVTPRWALKRGLKWAVEWGAELSGWGLLYRQNATFQRGYRILNYHKISNEPRDSFTVRTDHFRAHMAYLSDHHPVTALAELTKSLMHGEPPDPGSVAVSFDDGYLEAATVVSEILDTYSIPATFFVVTGILDGEKANPGGPYLAWSHVKSMAASGLDIGSHTVTHRSLGSLDPASVLQELRHSRNRIMEELGTAPEGVAYPYGTVRDFSPTVLHAAKTAGYLYGATAVHGLNHWGCDPFRLNRTTLMAGDGPRTFRLIMRGCLDPWRLVDRWGYALQHGRS